MNTKRWHHGFTIVELLIVVVVIAILAAITIVAYVGVTNRAHDTAVQNDLSALKRKLELFNGEHGRYPNNAEIITAFQGFKASRGSYVVAPVTDHNLIYCGSLGRQNYALAAYSKSGKKFKATDTSGVVEYSDPWTDQVAICQAVTVNYGSNQRGYAAEDTATGPWRPWT